MLVTSMFRYLFAFPLMFMFVTAYTKLPETNEDDRPQIHGHRGARGLFPENSIPAFAYATEIGVDVLEMDVVISADSMVIVSHEPYFSSYICQLPSGRPVDKSLETTYNIYRMTVEEIREFNCGGLRNERFPGQRKMAIYKPTLTEVLDTVAALEEKLGRAKKVGFNVEIKSSPANDRTYHPVPEEYVDLVLEVFQQRGWLDRLIIQSFDLRPLRIVNQKFPNVRVALLVDPTKSITGVRKELGFAPDIISPYYLRLRRSRVRKLQREGIEVIPWTVNSERAIKRMLKWQVDGIISDYPEKVMQTHSKRTD